MDPFVHQIAIDARVFPVGPNLSVSVLIPTGTG